MNKKIISICLVATVVVSMVWGIYEMNDFDISKKELPANEILATAIAEHHANKRFIFKSSVPYSISGVTNQGSYFTVWLQDNKEGCSLYVDVKKDTGKVIGERQDSSTCDILDDSINPNEGSSID